MNPSPPNHKITTLIGGLTAVARHEDGSTEEIKLRQIPLRDYNGAFQILDDEIALFGFMCEQDKAWVHTLEPESYEALRAAAWELNERGFFVFARRRSEREAAQRQQLMQTMSTLPPEMLERAARLGGATSPTPSPSSPPRAA